jgi:DNA-binding transcriptional ArsR family regulator
MSSPSGMETELSRDQIFELLSNPRRRMVLYYLREHGGSSTVTDLTREIASLEYDIPADELTRQQRKRIYVSLYQTHIPKLAEDGVIDYDEDSNAVRLTNRANKVNTYLSAEGSNSYPWPYHYLVLAITSVALLAVSTTVDVSPVTPLVVGLAVTAAFAVSGIVQLLQRRYRRRQQTTDLAENWLS